ncbi:hypothetical protein N7G274_005596 [Stereocaulon virgatum]|uniref:C2H2-type domain-containing protein n=1 Tax=Stereocaulon virgatum TaxID=373712 RepID=A0ABR4A7C6_9LECA
MTRAPFRIYTRRSMIMSGMRPLAQEVPDWASQNFEAPSCLEDGSDVEPVYHTPNPAASPTQSAPHWSPADTGSQGYCNGATLGSQPDEFDACLNNEPMLDAPQCDTDQAFNRQSYLEEERPEGHIQEPVGQEIFYSNTQIHVPLYVAHVGSQFNPTPWNYTKDAGTQDRNTATRYDIVSDNPHNTRLITDALFSSGCANPKSPVRYHASPQRKDIEDNVPIEDYDLHMLSTYRNRYARTPPESSSYSHRLPGILVSDPLGRTVAPTIKGFPIYLSGEDSITPDTLVADVCDIFYGLHTVWSPKLASIPELHGYCSALPKCWLFNTGVLVLQQCYHGVLPRTFGDLFALMHVAYSFTLADGRGDDTRIWDNFSSDVYQWHHALADGAEKGLFARVWDRLWCRQETPDTLLLALNQLRTFTPTKYPTAIGSSGGPEAMIVQSPVEPSADVTERTSIDWKPSDQPSLLFGGAVIRECSRFLDLFEYAGIINNFEHNPTSHECRSPQISFIQSMREHLIEPLRQQYTTPEFCNHIKRVEAWLRKGLFGGIRQLEVVLIWDSKSPQISSGTLETFMNDVATRCNTAIYPPDANWRNDYYATHLGMVSKLHVQKEQHSSFDFCLSWQIPAVQTAPIDSLQPLPNVPPSLLFDPRSSPTTHSLPRSPCLNLSETSYSDYPHTDTSIAYLSSSIPVLPVDAVEIPLTSDQRVRKDPPCQFTSPSSSTASAVSLESTTGVTRCPRCGKVFHGKPLSQSRSLRRHMKAEHNSNPRLRCPFPECDVTFKAGRSDNLRRHMEQRHGSALPSDLSAPTPRRRRSTG